MRHGTSAGAILAALSAENEARCTPPLSDDEVKTIANSVEKYREADTHRDDLIDELAELSAQEYDRRRKAAAKGLGVRVSTLDKEVAESRAEDEQDTLLRRWGAVLAILDAWGAPIYSIHPGPLWTQVVRVMGGPVLGRDDDGSARIYNEDQYGIARNQRICFVSAGPDGRFGTFAEFGGDTEAKEKARADNIHSYSPQWDAP